MALHVTIILLGVAVMAVCYSNNRNENYDPTDSGNLVSRNGETVNKWRNQESVQDIENQLKWGVKQLTKGSLNGVVKKSDNDKREFANDDTDYEFGKSTESEEECDNWFSCTESQKQEIINNLTFTFTMLSIIPMILFFEKVWKKLKEVWKGTSNSTNSCNDKSDVLKDVQKNHRRIKPKDSTNK